MAEKEYIERKALVEEIREAQRRLESCDDIKWERNKPYFKGLAWAHRIVLDAPAADVVEVRHGEWVQNPYCKGIFYCSECGRTVEDGSFNPNPSEHFPYCHCGAKMDGERKEEQK
jgi:hypothetical protein